MHPVGYGIHRKFFCQKNKQQEYRHYSIYQLPLKLLCCALPDKRCLSHVMCLFQVMMTLHFLNDVANDAESKQKLRHYR